MTEKPQVKKEPNVPGSISQTASIVKFELLNYFRARRFYVLLIITALIGALLSVVVGYYRPSSYITTQIGDQAGFFYNFWGQWIGFVITLSAIFFGGDAISGEFQNKTGYFLVPNPIRRSSIYVGKWLAALIAGVMIISVFAIITVANSVAYFGWTLPYQFSESLIFTLIYLTAVLGFTFFFSSLFKSASISILITAILFLFVFNLLQTLVSVLAQIEPWMILTYGSGIIRAAVSNPYPTTFTTPGPRGAAGFTLFAPTINEGLAIMAIYFIITAAVGLILFERKEFN